MLKRVPLEKLNDYFIDLGKRSTPGVYFCRINGYSRQIHEFIQKYYETARLSGVIIEGKLQNPDNNNLAYYNEIMGPGFQMELPFINASLRKWLPRMSDSQRSNVAGAIYETLLDLRKAGKNDNMLKNAYIKFMCWLYYKFERIVHQLGNDKLPKILYEGEIGTYELLLMNVLCIAGCDIVLLQYAGDAGYRKADPDSHHSEEISLPGMGPFPDGFNLKQIRADIQEAMNVERLYGHGTPYHAVTNTWGTGKAMEDIRQFLPYRGSDPNAFYNCFFRINGAEDKLTYENELYQLQLEQRSSKRSVVIVNQAIEKPYPDEISTIRRSNYQNPAQMIADLSASLRPLFPQDLGGIAQKAFVDVVYAESKNPGINLSRLTSRAVTLICWLKRYQNKLFPRWKMPEVACFFFFGVCKDEDTALFLRFLARLPVDVVIFNPNLNERCCLEDPALMEFNNEFSVVIPRYPEESGKMSTVGRHAERDLDDLMYTDTGIYRSMQYAKANSIILRTAYTEIDILWRQEMKYRPNFSTVDDTVNMPVLFAKVSGVEYGELPEYWVSIKKLLGEDTTLITQIPNITHATPNPIKPFAAEFYRNGRLQRSKIKNHKAYQYGILREPIQDYLLDKLQMLIDEKIIAGTGENGTEYTIVSVALNLDKNLLRTIQNFDFTKKNPKLIYVIPGETALSLEDTIYTAFLSLVGFDIVFFVPTGYQSVEKFFRKKMIEEHQIGPYSYDLTVPDFDTISTKPARSWFRRK